MRVDLPPPSQTRRVMLVGVPALVEKPAARLVFALSILIVFLVVQNERKPYMTAEHNLLASLAGSQITATLLFIVMNMAIPVPRVFGFFCIFLNVILLPLVICFNAKRLKRRKDILNAFLIEREVDEKATKKRRSTPERQAAEPSEFFNATYFLELWKAGKKSEFEVFCATLDWIYAALERPVAPGRWGQLLFTLEQPPLASLANADVRHGLMFKTQSVSSVLLKKFELAFGFSQGERWFGTVRCNEKEDSERVRSGVFLGELVLISKRALPTHNARADSKSQKITLLDVHRDGTKMSITIPYTVRGCGREHIIVQAKYLRLSIYHWMCVITGNVVDSRSSPGMEGAFRDAAPKLVSLL